MNAKQMKQNIRAFRAADVSIIKDDALRAQAQKLQAKQKGFTLLELLVVITLVATLATAALVAYEGIGENASDASAASAVNTMEGALRNYRAVEGEYPEQFDNLANVDAVLTDASGAMQLLAPETKAFFGQYAVAAAVADASGAIFNNVTKALAEVGIEELQSIQSGTTWNAGFVPNLAMNESYKEVSANAGSEIEFDDDGVVEFDEATITSSFANFALSIVPSADEGTGTCTVDGVAINATFDGTTVIDNKILNVISDGLDDDNCNLVIALGIGKEVPGATINSRVAIGQVATVGTSDISPTNNYARAIALFQVGTDINEDGDLDDSGEIFKKARLIAVVGPEGRTIDQLVAEAGATN